MSTKKKILVTIVAFVLLVIIVVPAILLFNGISAFSSANQDLNFSIEELRGLYNKEPFPSRDNIRLEKDNVLAVEGWFKKLMTALQQWQVTEEPSTPTGFITHYGHVRNNLTRLARQRDRNMISEDFGFGFDRYADGSLPAPVDVAVLMQQIRVIEQLTRVLIEAGVKQIADIQREEFEADAGSDSTEKETGTRTSRRRPPVSRRSSARTPSGSSRISKSPAGQPGDSHLYDKQRYTIEIKATEKVAIDVLNKLAGHKLFIVVTGVTFKKTGSDLRMPEKVEPGTESLSASTMDVATLRTGDDQPRQKRKVSGPDFEIPMTVTIDLDVYTFKSDSAK